MTSYLRKYVTALASAKDYVAQWSSEHVYANEVLIVPFPTLAIFDPEKHTWTVQIKAWLYLPFEGKKLKSYLPSLPSLFAGKPAEKVAEDQSKVDAEKQAVAVRATEETKHDESPEEKSDDNEDDDIYEDALRKSHDDRFPHNGFSV